jgi:hypothetical protein
MIPKSGNRFSEKIMRHSMAGPDMSAKTFGFLIVAGTLVVGSVAPASAEFFGCNEPRTKVSYSSRPAYSSHYAQAPRQRHTSYSSQSYRRVATQGRASQWH